MPLVFNFNIYPIKKIVLNYDNEVIFGLKDLIIFFSNMGLSLEESAQLNFMYNNMLFNDKTIIKMNNSEIVIITIDTHYSDIKIKLSKIFDEKGIDVSGNDRFTVSGNDRFTVSGNDRFTVSGNDKFTVSGNDRFTVSGNDKFTVSGNDRFTVNDNTLETHDIIDKKIIDEQNKKSIELFNDKDFVSLLNIYINRPELFNLLLQYTQTGIVIPTIPNNIDKLEILKLLNEIKKLNLNISDDIIINTLIKCNGHLNLTIRALLCDISKN